MEGSDFSDVTALLGPGVYVLTRFGRVVYVGQSRKLLTRLYSHKNVLERHLKGKPLLRRWGQKLPQVIHFDAVWIRPCKIEELAALEAHYISRWLPQYNRAVPKGAKLAIDLAELGLAPVASLVPAQPVIKRRVLA